MARHDSEFDRQNNRYTVNLGGTAARVIGVVLKTEIPQGILDSGTAGATRYTEDTNNVVAIRPTNVTATINSADPADPEAAPDYILLKNGPKGGFRQELPAVSGVRQVNSVIAAVITDA